MCFCGTCDSGERTPRGSGEPQDALCYLAAPEEGSEGEGSWRRRPGREVPTTPPDVWTPAPEGRLGDTGGELVAWGGLCKNRRALIREGSRWSAPAAHVRAQGADVEILSSAVETIQGLRLQSAGRVDRAAEDLKGDTHAEWGLTVQVSVERASQAQWPCSPGSEVSAEFSVEKRALLREL